MGKFRELRVWADAMHLAEDVYRVIRLTPLNKDFGLRDQIRRSAISIPSNIAEGDERGSNPQSVYFFQVAKGSTAELITQLELAHRIGYLEEDKHKLLNKQAEKIFASLIKLINARKR